MPARTEKKNQKLRNAEYYSMQNIQDTLYKQSLNGNNFYNLIKLITLEENIRMAFRNLRKNSGSKTCGTDKKNIEDIAKWSDTELIHNICARFENYIPQSVRRVEIPKPNGGIRPLGIPTIVDRLIQQCILQILEPICEAKFYEYSYGFRPNRSCEHAIAQCNKHMQLSNLYYVVDIDIKGFFDNVSHGKLLKQMWTLGIRDKALISVISKMLKAEVAGIGFPEKGTPQGGIISPLLSNIVLNELDWWIASQWESMPTRANYKGKVTKGGVMDKWPKYRALRTHSNLKECYIVRYADDFKIFCRSYREAKIMFEATKKWLKERLNLDISTEKSKIVNLKNHYTEFLGIRTKVVPKRNKNTVRSHITDKAESRIKEKCKLLIRAIEFPKNENDLFIAISRFNAYVIGIQNYYRMATSVAYDFKRIARGVRKSLKIRLQNRVYMKNGYLSPYFKERYGNYKWIIYANGFPLAPLEAVKHKNPIGKSRTVNKYTAEGRDEIHKNLKCGSQTVLEYLMRNPIKFASIELNDNRLSLYCAQYGKCAISGKFLEVGDIHIHHKTPVSKGGTDEYKNLLMVSVLIHKLIHIVDESLISELLKQARLNTRQIQKLNKYRSLVGIEPILKEKG